ncbi:MAG: hypothetical protein IKZ82_08995, partial [Clostridia bacterium]|nr:hypothetical protein [Clostridia bacterium]
MKKLLSLLMSAIMCLSLFGQVLAETTPHISEDLFDCIASRNSTTISANPDETESEQMAYFTVDAPTSVNVGDGAAVQPADNPTEPPQTVNPYDVEPYWTVPEGYNEHDYNRLVAFLEQTDNLGVTNGKKLCAMYDPETPHTWSTHAGSFVWTNVNGENRIERISFDTPTNGELIGILDLSQCTSLTELAFYNDSSITKINVSNCSALVNVKCDTAGFAELDASGCSALSSLNCGKNITKINVSGCISLSSLDCEVSSNLTTLDASGCSALLSLNCSWGNLYDLNLSGCSALLTLSCGYNRLDKLDVSDAVSLTNIECYNNRLTALDVSNNTALEYLYCYDNKLTALDVSNCASLKSLQCYNNNLTEIDLSSCTELFDLQCANNRFTELDLHNNPCIMYNRIYAEGNGYVGYTSLRVNGHPGCRIAAYPQDGAVFVELDYTYPMMRSYELYDDGHFECICECIYDDGMFDIIIARFSDASPSPSVGPLPTPTPETGLGKADDMFYENCYIADIWLNNYDGYGLVDGHTAESAWFDYVLDTPSLSEEMYNQLRNSWSFQASLHTWNGMMAFFDTDDYIYKKLDQKQLYGAIVLDYIARVVQDEGKKVENEILTAADMVGTTGGYLSKPQKIIDNLVKAVDIPLGGLPGSEYEGLLDALKYWEFDPQDSTFVDVYQNLCNTHDFLQAYSDQKTIKTIGMIANTATDISDFFERVAAYVCLMEVSNEMTVLLTEMYAQSNNGNLRAAIADIIKCIQDTDHAQFVLSTDFAVNIVGKTMIDEFVDFIWESYAPVWLRVLQLGYKFGSIVSNMMCNTQGIIDKYYMVEATTHFLHANNAAVRALANRYLSSETEYDAGAYVYAMKMYKYAEAMDLDAAVQLAGASEREGLGSQIGHGAATLFHNIIGEEYEDSYDVLVKNCEHIIEIWNDVFDLCSVNWKYMYLKHDHPDVFPLYAIDDLSLDTMRPRVYRVMLNDDGKTEIRWSIPSMIDSATIYYQGGALMLDGFEIKENVGDEITTVYAPKTARKETVYTDSQFAVFPKEYSVRGYTESDYGRIYTQECTKVLENPLKAPKLLVGKINDRISIVIHDSTDRKYNVVYRVLRKANNSDYELIDTINKNNSFILLNMTNYTDTTVEDGASYTYKIVSELEFSNGEVLRAESDSAICIIESLESAIRELNTRIVNN